MDGRKKDVTGAAERGARSELDQSRGWGEREGKIFSHGYQFSLGGWWWHNNVNVYDLLNCILKNV